MADVRLSLLVDRYCTSCCSDSGGEHRELLTIGNAGKMPLLLQPVYTSTIILVTIGYTALRHDAVICQSSCSVPVRNVLCNVQYVIYGSCLFDFAILTYLECTGTIITATSSFKAAVITYEAPS